MKFLSIFMAIVFAAAIFFAAAPIVMAQNQSVTTVSTSPDGPVFSVDGTNYAHAMSFIWPQGSKHTLSTQPNQQPGLGIQYAFGSWTAGPTAMLLNQGTTLVITADPSITFYQASFTVGYALTVNFNNCTSGACASPGIVTVNGLPLTTSQQIYVPAGNVTLQASPNPGWVFSGWQSATAQTIAGAQTTVAVNAPTTITAVFAQVQYVNLATVPAGLSVLADRTQVFTPIAMQWGLNTVHTLAPISPQEDNNGGLWVFGSWSDGGAATHAYTVPGLSPATVTANFVPGVAVELLTSPQGLNLTVDGRTNWPSYTFVWSAGETHTLLAPATQTDSQGRNWAFANWSNGGGETQSLTVPQSSVGVGMRLIANYTQSGHLTVTSALAGLSVTVNGTACAVPCDIQQPLGTQLTIGAPASVPAGSGSRQDFTGWSNGAGTGTLAVTLGTNAITVAANYRLMNYLATSASPAGAASWSLQPASPDGFYDAMTNVSIAVTPLPGFRFQSWSGDLSGSAPAATLAMSLPRAVQAAFYKVPYIAPSGVTNGAGATPQTGVAPGSIVSVFGANLANSVALGPAQQMLQTLSGTTVQTNGSVLPLFFVSPTQINFQLPSDVPPGTQTLTVSTQGQPDVQVAFNVVQDAPGLFPSVVNDQTYAVATHADGSPVTLAAPVQQGETITLYGTGFGPCSPARPFGFAVPQSPAYLLTDAATIQIGSAAPVVPAAAFASPGSVGVDTLQFVLGSDAPSGTSAQLTVTINGQISNMVLLPIQ